MNYYQVRAIVSGTVPYIRYGRVCIEYSGDRQEDYNILCNVWAPSADRAEQMVKDFDYLSYLCMSEYQIDIQSITDGEYVDDGQEEIEIEECREIIYEYDY